MKIIEMKILERLYSLYPAGVEWKEKYRPLARGGFIKESNNAAVILARGMMYLGCEVGK